WTATTAPASTSAWNAPQCDVCNRSSRAIPLTLPPTGVSGTRSVVGRLRLPDAAAPDGAQEVGQPDAQERVLALLVAHGGGRTGVVVAVEQHGVVGKLGQALGQTAVHLGRVPARQVGPPAAADEQRVPGDQAPVDVEALGAGRVARG